MSITERVKDPDTTRVPSRRTWLRSNAASWFALIGGRPRAEAAAKLAWRAPLRLGTGGLLVLALLAGTMNTFDAWAITQAQRLPLWLARLFDEVSDFGKSGWILVPTGVALLAIAALASPALPRIARLVLMAVSVRIGFIFLAVGLPGLAVTVVKRLIGRARPLIGGSDDPFHYLPFGWSVQHASLPSGHATTAFAAAVAIGAIWPRARAVMWTYAVLVAVSRVVLTAHYPSDVIAGAIVGIVGALLVRDWFAASRLGFVIAPDGRVRILPGPSLRRIKEVAVRLLRA